jgi:hypothetical protein
MRKTSAATVVILLGLLPSQAFAAVKAGSTCSKAGVTTNIADFKFTCTKSGKKLLWSHGVKTIVVPPPLASANPSPSATPSATATPEKTFASLWEKYGLTKPTSVDFVIKAATDNFKNYTSTFRSTQEVKVDAQAGVDPQLVTWVQGGATFVAQHFTYPKLSRTFVDVIAIDSTWLQDTYAKEGYSADQVRDRLGGFNAGAPAFGGSYSNTWNFSAMQKSNAMVNNKEGMAQTPGHEFFHAIQEILAGRISNETGTNVPNWFWEGPAMFIGEQTSGTLGYSDYVTAGRPSMIARYQNGDSINRTSTLSEIKANNRTTDPYAIGFAGTEFLVSQVGIEKMLNVYAALGKGMNFSGAFKEGTSIELSDFYSMFEEVRGTLGFAKN